MSAIDLYANDLILFVHIVEAGSFTRAADRTGLPKATLSRRLARLEERLGGVLLQRSTRRLVLTEFGEQMLGPARRLLEDNAEVTALAQREQHSPQGVLRVSLPPEFEEFRLAELVSRYLERCPEVRLELHLSARRVDLLAERFDIAVRAASHLADDSTLVARRVATLEHGLYASPAYLQRHGEPREPADLAAHAGLLLSAADVRPLPWHLQRAGQSWEGLPREVLTANSVGLLQALAARGLGVVGLSHVFARRLLAEGALVPVLASWTLPAVNIWCVTRGRRLLPRRTSMFIDILREMLGGGQPEIA